MQQSASSQLATDFINFTSVNVFLTGKAGTGKTTFLRACKETAIKNVAIVAPTGVAAMNAGGTTIHSFFQLPFTPYLPVSRRAGSDENMNDKDSLLSRLRLTNDRKEVLQQLELLIIDEISMVRCDVLDAIDIILKHVRNNYLKPFGGVQLLFIGDMYQLPPVVKEEEWQLLSPYYKSPYFFNSLILENEPPVYISLEKIYRQSDPAFVRILNQVRNNEMDEESFDLLHSRYQPAFIPSKEDNFITLTTHNLKADAINNSALNEISAKLETFDAVVEGEFHEKLYPAEMELKLKVGAQVMFIKNDTEKIRRYFNGKIGTIESITDEKIMVSSKGEYAPIEVKKETWKNIKYAVDKSSNKIEENEIGSFTQYPLRLAWAITIHKSQGLSFEKAIIDAGQAFAPGQVYVALSRCTNMEGMILRSKILIASLKSDQRIVSFANTQQTNASQLRLLSTAKKQFQTDEILQLFDFSEIEMNAKALLIFITSALSSFNTLSILPIEKISTAINECFNTGQKFKFQLIELLQQEVMPEENNQLQKRIIAAVQHFIAEIEKIKLMIENDSSETDNKTLADEFNKLLSLVYKHCCIKLHQLKGNQQGFLLADYLKHKKAFKKPMLMTNAYAGKSTIYKTDIANPELYQLIKKRRDEICNKRNIPVYLVANSKTLEDMALYLPQSIPQLNQIAGFGPVKSRQYGEDFLTIIRDYCEEHELQGGEIIKTKKKDSKKKTAVKADTKKSSFDLFKTGKSIDEIAFERKITVGTVQSHLCYFIETGQLDISEIIPAHKIASIRAAINNAGNTSAKILKENLPENIGYGEIKMVMADLNNQL